VNYWFARPSTLQYSFHQTNIPQVHRPSLRDLFRRSARSGPIPLSMQYDRIQPDLFRKPVKQIAIFGNIWGSKKSLYPKANPRPRRRGMTTKRLSRVSTASATPTSEDLIARAQRGEEAAFRELFERNRRRVYSICLRMTHNFSDAEDLTQDAFLLVFRKISTFRGEASFSTWLYRLTVNVVLMHLRRNSIQHVSLDEGENSLGEPVGSEVADDDRRLMGTIDRINLKKALADLPPGYRTAFVMFDQEGYEHREIAQMMNWSVGNSKSQLHKARRRLREWF